MEIKIFLASSIEEFAYERLELADFLVTLSNIYIDKGIFLAIEKCEYVSDAMVIGGKQNEYNEIIKKSRYFYVLFGKKAGQYTVEEFDIALEQFCTGGFPHIYTYFRNLSENEEKEKSVVDFKERLEGRYGHHCSCFTHIDIIKLNLLLELSGDSLIGGNVQFRDGQAFLDNQWVMSLENVPFYRDYEPLKQLREQREKTDDPAETRQLGERIHEIEADMLAVCMENADNRRFGIQLSPQQKRAMELEDAGDYEGVRKMHTGGKTNEEN